MSFCMGFGNWCSTVYHLCGWLPPLFGYLFGYLGKRCHIGEYVCLQFPIRPGFWPPAYASPCHLGVICFSLQVSEHPSCRVVAGELIIKIAMISDLLTIKHHHQPSHW